LQIVKLITLIVVSKMSTNGVLESVVVLAIAALVSVFLGIAGMNYRITALTMLVRVPARVVVFSSN